MIIDSKQYAGKCSCGRTHKMETQFCVIERGCLKNISAYMRQNGIHGYCVAVYDDITYRATANRHPQVDAEVILPAEDLHANEFGVALLVEKLPKETEIILAIGAGTIHDLSRYCAYKKNIVFVSCPTAASVDGFCSTVAAMTWNGCKKTMTAVAPKIVVADLDIIRNAPIRLAKSGFGDMVGKYISLTDWKISNILANEYYCDRIAKMTFQATETVIDSIDGIIAGEERAYQNLVYGLLLSGLAMQMIGNSRPASGAEHHISHIIEMQPQGLGVHSEALHGEKVGVGTLLVLEKYQKIAASPDVCFTDYVTYSPKTIQTVFGSKMSSEIAGENQNDVASGITGDDIRVNFDRVIQEIAKLPNAECMEKLYKKARIKGSLFDIGVPKEKKEQLLKYAPMVRNRLTLLRLLSGGAIYTKLANKP